MSLYQTLQYIKRSLADGEIGEAKDWIDTVVESLDGESNEVVMPEPGFVGINPLR